MKKHKQSFRSSIRFLLTFLMVLALIVPFAGTGGKVSGQTGALTALEIFPQIPLDIPAPMAPNPKPDNTPMPAGIPAGSVALFQILGVLDSDIAALEWNIGKPPVTVYSANGTKIIDAPKKGDLVKVYALRTIVPGPLVVEEIKLTQAGPVVAGKPETHLSFLFNGDTGATTTATMTVGGMSFIINNPSKPAIMSDGQEGPVTVRFDILGTGAVAPVVKPPVTPAVKPAADNTTITGIVTNISGNRYTVGTTVAVVSAMTKVEKFPMVGDEVQVRGQLQLDGSIIASRIRAIGLMGVRGKAKEEKPKAMEVRFTGIVNGTGNKMWLIGNSPLNVDGNTRLVDNPRLGLVAEVRGYQQADGMVLAYEIRNRNKDGRLQPAAPEPIDDKSGSGGGSSGSGKGSSGSGSGSSGSGSGSSGSGSGDSGSGSGSSGSGSGGSGSGSGDSGSGSGSSGSGGGDTSGSGSGGGGSTGGGGDSSGSGSSGSGSGGSGGGGGGGGSGGGGSGSGGGGSGPG